MLVVVVFGFSVPSLAQEITGRAAPAVSPADGDLFQVRLRYAAAIRNGTEDGANYTLGYSGVSPNDLALSAWAFPLLSRHLGVTVGVQREAFGLYSGATVVTSGALLRAHAGLAGRLRIGSAFGLDGSVSYGLAQVPLFGATNTFSSVSRHAVLLAARGVVDLGPLSLEARFEYPVVLATTPSTVTSSGLGVGGGVRIRFVQTGDLDWGLMGDVTWNRDSTGPVTVGAGPTATQSIVRAGVGLDLRFREPAPLAAGQLRVRVSGGTAPIPVRVQSADGERTVTAPADGSAVVVDDLRAGEISVSATLPGFVVAQARGTLRPGEDLELALVLTRDAPAAGALTVTVVSKDPALPLTGLRVEVNGVAALVRGSVASVGELPPGPISVRASAAEFTDGDEAATIVPGKTTELTVTLVPVKKRVPATVSGLVRSARGGQAVRAKLEVLELKQLIEVDDKGACATDVPGGRYTVRISAPGFRTQQKSVTVRDGDQAIFNVDLSPR